MPCVFHRMTRHLLKRISCQIVFWIRCVKVVQCLMNKEVPKPAIEGENLLSLRTFD